MPIYEYRCTICHTVFEEWHKYADDIRSLPCPACKGEAERLISNTTFMLKGGGWYVTEYGSRKKEDANAAETTGTAGTSETPASADSSAASAPKAESPAPVAKSGSTAKAAD
jgi:putative FmdB family regulatory protein